METRLCIGIPTHKEYCNYKFFINFIQLAKPKICQTFIYDDQPVSKCRNRIVKHALEWGATHILFIDDDMTLPENAIGILLGHNKDIVGLLAFRRKDPFLPVLYSKDPNDEYRYITMIDYEKGLIPVDATGAACLLVSTAVFRNLPYPWFDFVHDPDKPGEMLSEDLYFCRKAKEKGYSIYVDTNDIHTVGHLGTIEVTHKAWEANKTLKFSNIGKGQVDRTGNVIPADIKILIE